LILLQPLAASAREIPEHFVPVGPTAMGGAFTGIANDENAIWTNPAGVGRVRKARSRGAYNVLMAPVIIAGANSAGRSFYSAIQGSKDKTVEQLVDESSSLGNKPFWARTTAILPQAMFDLSPTTPVAVTLFSNIRTQALIEKDSASTAHMEAVSDLGGVFTYGFTDKGNRLNFGVQLRPTYRYAYEAQVPSEELLDKTKMQDRIQNESNESQGLGVDLGLLYTVADFWFPTIGFAILNAPTGCKSDYLNPYSKVRESVCGTKYSGDLGNPDALSVLDPTDIRLGMAITPRFGRKTAVRFGLDLHHIPLTDGTNHYGLNKLEFAKMMHAGAEIFFGNPLLIPPLSVRVGYSQGFISLGGRLSVNVFTFELASYGTDVSSTASPIEDRRYLASFGLNF
jgi:hypothetical protein